MLADSGRHGAGGIRGDRGDAEGRGGGRGLAALAAGRSIAGRYDRATLSGPPRGRPLSAAWAWNCCGGSATMIRCAPGLAG